MHELQGVMHPNRPLVHKLKYARNIDESTNWMWCHIRYFTDRSGVPNVWCSMENQAVFRLHAWPGHTIYPNSVQVVWNRKIFLSNSVCSKEIRSHFASLEIYVAFSRADSCVLDSSCLACFGGKLSFMGVANRSPTLLSGLLLAFQSENSLNAFDSCGLLETGAHTVVPDALDNLSMGKGEKGRQDPLLRCYHIENSYHQSCQHMDRCVNTLRPSSPEQLPISFKQMLL